MKKRWDCLAELLKDNNHKIGAEIGVWKGDFTYNIFELLPSIEMLYCVDPWIMYDDYKKSLQSNNFIKADYENIFKNFKKRMKKFEDRITIIRSMSEEALKIIPDRYLDFIFIDANHSYEYAKQDIINWSPKVKKGGLLSGHDYGRNKYSDIEVTKAVDELIPNVKKGYNGVWYIWMNI